MNNVELSRYKELLLAKRGEITKVNRRTEFIRSPGEPQSDPVDMAATETDAAIEARVHESDRKLLRAIEEALSRIRGDRYGRCEECGEPITTARLEAVPWTRSCRDCKAREDTRS